MCCLEREEDGLHAGKHDGSLCKAWKQTLDKNRSGTCSKEEFVASMRRLGWDGDAGGLAPPLVAGRHYLPLGPLPTQPDLAALQARFATEIAARHRFAEILLKMRRA